jgi:hypothetical protein
MNNPGISAMGKRLVDRIIGIDADEGAGPIVHLATAPEVAGITGAYFNMYEQTAPSESALNDAAARRLWIESERLAGPIGVVGIFGTGTITPGS